MLQGREVAKKAIMLEYFQLQDMALDWLDERKMNMWNAALGLPYKTEGKSKMSVVR